MHCLVGFFPATSSSCACEGSCLHFFENQVHNFGVRKKCASDGPSAGGPLLPATSSCVRGVA